MGQLHPAEECLLDGERIFESGSLDASHDENASRYGYKGPCTLLTWLSLSRTLLGFMDQGAAYAEKVVEVSKATEHLFSVAFSMALGSVTFICQRREPERIRSWGETMIEIGESQGYPFWVSFGRSVLGCALLLRGQLNDSVIEMERGLGAWLAIGNRTQVPMRHVWLAEVEVVPHCWTAWRFG